MTHGTAARVEAQAKINLSLRILAQERSGYHQLETLFARIALADTVEIPDGAVPACKTRPPGSVRS